LVGLQPTTATVVDDGTLVKLPIAQLVVGNTVRVHPGERIAADGVVTDGQSYVDESMISGEPVPAAKSIGDDVTGGTVNGAGSIDFQVSRTGDDTTLAQIIRMVEDAQGAKLPIQELVNKITMWFVPAVLALAALTVAAWLVFGPEPSLGLALVAGVAVLIVACPCAMGLATPTSIMVGTGRAAELGVLFRKGDALQTLQNADIVAFDKTGTLTEGRPTLTTFEITEGFNEVEVLGLTASVEAKSEHPIAQAIVRHAGSEGLDLADIGHFDSLTGFGVRATVSGHDVLIGADRLMQREGVSIDALASRSSEIAQQGETPLFVAIDGRLAALVGVSDPIKPMSADAIGALHAMGKTIVLITGDKAATAQVIADRLGIDQVVAEVLPAGKVDALIALKKEGRAVAFVGDGINDAPALAAADVGIAIGTGTDIAIESADVVLMSGDIAGVVRAFEVSCRTMRNIKQNLFWAFAYNAALIPVAAGALYIFGGPLLSPMLAAGAMALSSVFVLSNALRLRWISSETGAVS
jgi:Cu+-exporting ATPase